MDGYILADAEGKLIDVNTAYCQMIGYDKEELLAMNIRQLEAELSSNEVDRRIKQMLETGKDKFETKHRQKDGHIIDLDVSISVMNLEDTRVVAAFVRDITKRKIDEKALIESEEKFRGIYEQSPLAIQLYDLEGKLVDVNQQTLDLFGINDIKHILGFNLWEDPHLTSEKAKSLRRVIQFPFQIVLILICLKS